MKVNLRRQTTNLIVVCFILLMMIPGATYGQKVKVGQPAPDFTIPLLDGRRAVRLSDFRGRRVIIFTWASW